LSPTRPAQTFLAQNVPNPFNPATTISFGLADAGHVTLRIYDASGRLVRTLVDRSYGTVRHDAMWNGRNDRGQPVTTGIYFCLLSAGGETFTQKMLLLK
jgi:flagellar hook assembly protein FlgD